MVILFRETIRTEIMIISVPDNLTDRVLLCVGQIVCYVKCPTYLEFTAHSLTQSDNEQRSERMNETE